MRSLSPSRVVRAALCLIAACVVGSLVVVSAAADPGPYLWQPITPDLTVTRSYTTTSAGTSATDRVIVPLQGPVGESMAHGKQVHTVNLLPLRVMLSPEARWYDFPVYVINYDAWTDGLGYGVYWTPGASDRATLSGSNVTSTGLPVGYRVDINQADDGGYAAYRHLMRVFGVENVVTYASAPGQVTGISYAFDIPPEAYIDPPTPMRYAELTIAARYAPTTPELAAALPPALWLSIDPLLLGDANNDGRVDAADYRAVEQHLGNTGIATGAMLGDANDDGRVDGADILFIDRYFGATLSGTVPEPTTGALLLACLIPLTRRPRPRK